MGLLKMVHTAPGMERGGQEAGSSWQEADKSATAESSNAAAKR